MQRKQRLPVGVVQKLQQNAGGGTHKSKRKHNRKHDKALFNRQVKEIFN